MSLRILMSVAIVACCSPVARTQVTWSGPFMRAWSQQGILQLFPLAITIGAEGDFDADGYQDLALGNDLAFYNHGGIAAFRGLDGAVLWVTSGPNSSPSCPAPTPPYDNTKLGDKRLVVTDLDGDQISDVLASGWGKCHATWQVAPNVFAGLSGSVIGLRGFDGTILFENMAPSIPGSGGSGQTVGYGFSFDGGQDVTGDGVPDVIASAYGWGLPGEPFRGIVFGTAQGSNAPFSTFPGVKVGDCPGGAPSSDGAVEFLDDVDGDGTVDFLVSSGVYPIGSWPPGPGYVFAAGIVRLHSGNGFQVLNSVEGGGPNFGFGHFMGSTPDLDGDGIRDFYASVKAHSTSGSLPGPFSEQRVEIRSGATFSLIRTIYFVDPPWVSQVPLEREIGPSIVDIEGDGLPEIVLPSCGQQSCVLKVASLTTGATVHTWVFPSSNGNYWMGGGAGDLNGDGLGDVVIFNRSASSSPLGIPHGLAEAWFSRNLRLTARPLLGTQVGLEVSTPAWPAHYYRLLFSTSTGPPISFGPFVLHIAADSLFWLSLSSVFGGQLDAAGKGTFPIQVPNDPTLAGTTFFVSGVVLDPLATIPIGTVLTTEEILIQ